MPRGAKASKTCSLDTMKPEKAVSIFKMKHLKAWWPFSINTEQDEPKVVGKCEAEIELLTQEEALKEPAGKGREEPQPLDKPK